MEYRRLILGDRQAGWWKWQVMTRNSWVLVRGRVRHADHATIELPDWHRVVMNTEGQAQAMRSVAFLD